MKYTNPQSLTAQAMQEAKAANQRAEASVRAYQDGNFADVSLEQLWQFGQANDMKMGWLSWDNSIAPNGNNAIVILGGWMVLAISFDGTLYRLDNNPYRWTKIPE